MPEDNQQLYDVNEVEMKLPTDTQTVTDEPVKQVSVLPYILVIIIIILLAILGGLIWWGATLLQNQETEAIPEKTIETLKETNQPETNQAIAEEETLQALSTSNDLDAIKADLEGTPVDNLTKELIIIENELGF